MGSSFDVRKRSDLYVSVLTAFVAWGICLAIDWIAFLIFKARDSRSTLSFVSVLLMVNAVWGLQVWKKFDQSQKFVILFAFIAAIVAIVIVPTQARSLSPEAIVRSVVGISIGNYFGIPVQRLIWLVSQQDSQ